MLDETKSTYISINSSNIVVYREVQKKDNEILILILTKTRKFGNKNMLFKAQFSESRYKLFGLGELISNESLEYFNKLHLLLCTDTVEKFKEITYRCQKLGLILNIKLWLQHSISKISKCENLTDCNKADAFLK